MKCTWDPFRSGPKRGKGLLECGKPAHWTHPRWPGEVFCQHHKDTLAEFWAIGWEKKETI